MRPVETPHDREGFFRARGKGAPIVAFAAACLENPVVLYALEKSAIRTPDDLLRKRLQARAATRVAAPARRAFRRIRRHTLAIAAGHPYPAKTSQRAVGTVKGGNIRSPARRLSAIRVTRAMIVRWKRAYWIIENICEVLTMHKLCGGLAVIGVVVIFSTFAEAGCSCVCVDGQIKAGCTDQFQTPPICALRTCPFGSLKPPEIGSTRSCGYDRTCDVYGHCEWKLVCKGDVKTQVQRPGDTR